MQVLHDLGRDDLRRRQRVGVIEPGARIQVISRFTLSRARGSSRVNALNRSVSTHYDKRAAIFDGTMQVASIRIWLRDLTRSKNSA